METDTNTFRQGCESMGDMDALRQAYAEKRWADAWAEYRRLVALGEASVEAHLFGARAADAQGDLLGARQAADRAMDWKPDGAMLAQLLMTRGVILLEIGEGSPAVEDFQTCLAELAGLPDLAPVMAGPAWYNLGRSLRQVYDCAGAVVAYQHAIDLFRREGMQTYLCMALHNLAWALCCLGDLQGAREALEESKRLSVTEYLRWHQVVGEAFAASLEDGEEKRRALDMCEQLMTGPPDLPVDVRSHAYWIAGRTALALGMQEQALSLANQAVSLALQAEGQNRSLADAAELLRQVKAATMQPQTGA